MGDKENIVLKYGKRPDGTNKGSGFLGEIPTGNGDEIMTEKSIGVNINGKETLIPSIVPTLSKDEIEYLKTNKMPNEQIIKKAVDHANNRINNGLSPFKDENESILEDGTSDEKKYKRGLGV